MIEGSPYNTVPKIVPSGCLDALSCKLVRNAKSHAFTIEYESIQTALKC